MVCNMYILHIFLYFLFYFGFHYRLCSVAKCLGARRVTEKAFQWMPNHPVTSVVVQDKEAVSACLKFASQ